MNIKRIDASTLTAPEILSLLEIASGFSAVRPDWNQLRGELEHSEAWCFCEADAVVGFVLVDFPTAYYESAAKLTALCYRWEYGDEGAILQMLSALAAAYFSRVRYLLLDIDCRHDLNLDLYLRFGFQTSILPSTHGRQNVVLIADLREPLNQSSAAEQRIFFAHSSVSKVGNTSSIPPLFTCSVNGNARSH